MVKVSLVVIFVIAFIALLGASQSPPDDSGCLGEFQRCSGGDCVLSPSDCGKCGHGQFLCPTDQKTCVSDANSVMTCPGIKGTHWVCCIISKHKANFSQDWTLPLDQRLDYHVAHTTVSERIAQLTNDAPEIRHLGIPHYNWYDN